MKKILINTICLLLLLLPACLFAQDITGLWKGELYVDSTKKYLPYEISISEVKGKLVGYSLITFEENGKQETGTRDITIERKDDKIIIEDVSLIDNSFSFVPPKSIKKTMIVSLTVDDTIMVMKGNWSTNRTKRFLPATGSVTMQRKSDFKATVLYKKLDDLKLADKLVFNEPVQKPAIATIETIQTPNALTNPDVKKPAPIKEPVVVAVTKPAEEKKITPPPVEKPVVADVKKSAPAVAVATPPAAIKKPEVIVPSPAKQVPAPVVVVAKTPVETPIKPTPTPVIAAKPIEVAVIVDKKADPIKVPSVALGAADINKRTIVSTESVFYESDSLVLTLYDNGYVDGDTVSVVMNGELIFSKQGLSTRAVSKTIHINKETPDSITLVMYAENLGSIPPNTGLLVVHDGDNVYDVRFTADLKTNAAIILKRKKKL